jgi:NADH dehydrogenase FAD-containing subunit
MELERFLKMVQNWAAKIKVFVSPNIKTSFKNKLSKLNISVYRGIITNVNHTNTKVESVSFESGEKIEVDTLLWIPSKRPSPLIQRLVENLGLELDE